jgi:hypothetical protein
VYVGQTGCTITTRCKEHDHHIQLQQPEKSVVAEHSIETGHKLGFDAATVLAKSTGYMDRLINEGTETQLHSNNFSGKWTHVEPGMVSSY